MPQVAIHEVRCVVNDRKDADRFDHKLCWRRKLHRDIVTSVRYIEELNSIVSTSADASLSILDVENRFLYRQLYRSVRSIHIARFPERRLVGHTRGVNACGWSSFYKFICSGGQDRLVILWNPFSLKPLASLIGHAAPVVSVAVHDRGNQLISLSADKCIKVHRPTQSTSTIDFPPGVGYTKSRMSTDAV